LKYETRFFYEFIYLNDHEILNSLRGNFWIDELFGVKNAKIESKKENWAPKPAWSVKEG
jgi:hypothetical protein